MMLLYKAWRESRSRFVGGVLLLAVYCCFMLRFRSAMDAPFTARLVGHSWPEYIDNVIFGSFGKIAFVLLAIFLGLGGLLRERANHTAIFSLALPVSRLQLIGAHLAVGLTELGVMALVPVVLVQTLSGLLRQTYPWSSSLRYSLVRFICGALIFAISFLLSVVLKGEFSAAIACFLILLCLRPVAYTPAIACYMSLFLTARLADVDILRPYWLNPLAAMTDGGRGPFPWLGLSVTTLTATTLLAVAVRITQRQNL